MKALRIGAWSLAGLIPLSFLAVFFIWPVGAMLLRGITGADGGLDFSTFAEVLGTSRTWAIIWHTLFMAVAGTAGSVLLGVPGAYILYRTRFPGQTALRNIATVPFVLPTVVVGVAFQSLLNSGSPLGFLGLNQTTTAVVLAMVFFNFSVVIRQVGGLWQLIDPQSTDAARTMGATKFYAFRTVTLPALWPAIASSAGLVFLFCSTAYGLVRSLGSPGVGTVETEVYRQTHTFLDLRTAAVFSILQLIFVLSSVYLTQRTSNKLNSALALTQPHRIPLQRSDIAPLVLTIVVIAVLILWPLVSLVLRSFQTPEGFSLHNYQLLATTSGTGFAGGVTVMQALEHSVKIALDATIITMAMGIPLAVLLTRPVRSTFLAKAQKVFDAMIMLPLGVSSVTVGFGFLVSLQWVFPDLAGTGALVPLAQSVVALPLVIRTLIPVLAAIDPQQRESAATLGASPLRVLLTVDGPYLLRAIGLATGFGFAVSLGEFGATSFLSSPSYQTLPVLIVRLLSRPGADNFGMAMAASVVLAGLTALALLVAERLRPRQIRNERPTA